jgi:hypothetical protein
MKVKATTDTRIRYQPDTTNDLLIAAVLPAGAVVEAEPAPGAAGWYRFVFTIGSDKPLKPSVKQPYSLYMYALAELFTPVGTPPPPPPASDRHKHAKYQLGVNVLQFTDYGLQALKDGCRFVLFMDNGGGALQAAIDYPDAIIMYRRYHSSKLSPEAMFNILDIDWSRVTGNFIITLSNESDTWNPNNLPEYFAWFKEVAKLIWARNPNAILAFGSWGHGNPNWVDRAVADYFRDTVAPWLNANARRVVLDLHMYTKGKRRSTHPVPESPMFDMVWFETRHQFAYQNGLSKSVRHVGGEGGVEAAHGGFTWAGYTTQQFKEWAFDVVNGERECDPPPLGVALYHLGDHVGWRGYWLQPYYGALREFWFGDVPYRN